MSGMPVNIEYERLVLGACLLYPELLHAARPVLEANDFSLEKHRRIWNRSCGLYDAGTPVECATVIHALQDSKELESCGGFNGVNDLTDGVPNTTNLDHYVAGVKDKAILRNIIRASQRTINRCMEGVDTPQAILESLNETALTMVPQAKNTGLQSAAELVDEIGLARILSPRKNQGLQFPWPWMNYRTNGMLPAELWVLAGHTSTGKTSAMLQHAVTAARRGHGVAIFSLEVGKVSIFQKACYQMARVDSERAKRGKLTHEEMALVTAAANELYDLPLYFDTQSNTTMAIHASLRRRILHNKIEHVIVDYLQLLGNTGRHDNRAQAVGANAWAMKIIATDFQVPVLLLSQFSRQQGNKPGQTREPELGDLKESGDIENHANGVWFLHRNTNEDAEQIPVKFMLPKQRDGRRNVFQDFWFFPNYQRFEQQSEGDWE